MTYLEAYRAIREIRALVEGMDGLEGDGSDSLIEVEDCLWYAMDNHQKALVRDDEEKAK
jgi:hypothetical protein